MNIRNFAIIAHIDHGKSTLADRIMEICGAVGKDHRQQLLDSLELEREHGITIKLKAIRLNYTFNSQLYTFNLLDTPGHVDFSYEVSRSLASVEGAVLVVDATQGVQAQTLANFHLALESNLILIPVINKIDSPQAKIKETEKELTGLGFKGNEIVKVSAKTGEGVENLINAIIARIPSPSDLTSQLSALIFDSALDPYKGVVATVRLFGGKLKAGDEILLIAGGTKSTVLQIGYLTPAPKYVQNLESGEVGFVVTSLKDLSSVKVGDTIVVSQLIKEGEKERQTPFEGIIITRKHGNEIGATFTVRTILQEVGVEKIYPIQSPNILRIEIISPQKKVRRSKLYYLRELSNKKVREKLKVSM